MEDVELPPTPKSEGVPADEEILPDDTADIMMPTHAASKWHKSLASPGRLPLDAHTRRSIEQRVRHAKYMTPRSLSGGAGSARRGDARGFESPRGFYKTERWRERGTQRWPPHAAEELQRQPSQFSRAERVVPLQRTTEAQQDNLYSELWLRSLRGRGLHVAHVGLHNQNVANASVAVMFDRHGHGWTGKTRTAQHSTEHAPMEDWVERPVAVGKVGINHMGGTRYRMDATPRECVPNSMTHFSPPSSARSAAARGTWTVR